MEKVSQLIAEISKNKNCIVKESLSQPLLPPNLCLPKDLEFFYAQCGGVILFLESDYPMEIVGPADFVRANPIIAGVEGENDRSYHWFIIGKLGSQYITIDLDTNRLGKCYDSFWEIYGLVGDMPVIATDFTTLLLSLYKNEGNYWYWLKEDFHSLGDAYD